jgi:hypothetical protein
MAIEIEVPKIEILGETRPLPPEFLGKPEVRALVELIREKAELEPLEAQRYVEALLSSTLLEIGGTWAEEMTGIVREIVEIRGELRSRYARALDLIGKPGAELPPELAPHEIGELFQRLAERVEELKDPEAWLDEHPDIVEDIKGGADDLDKFLHGEEAVTDDHPTAPDEPPGGADFDRPPRTEEYKPRGLHKLSESERAELNYYRDALQGRDPQGVRDVLEEAINDFFGPGGRMELPAGWNVELIKSPEYGARVPQQATLGAGDPLFAANGYELRFTAPDGTQFQPDAIEFVGGDRFLLHEFKDPLDINSPEAYRNNEELLLDLRDTMLERAYLSRALPGCEGWQYQSSLEGMNQLFAEIISDALKTNPELKGRLLPPDFPGGVE